MMKGANIPSCPPSKRSRTSILDEQNKNKETTSNTELLAGLLTSRTILPSPLNFILASEDRARLRIRDNSYQVFPQFADCPDWTKPLIFAEYQVLLSKNKLIRSFISSQK